MSVFGVCIFFANRATVLKASWLIMFFVLVWFYHQGSPLYPFYVSSSSSSCEIIVTPVSSYYGVIHPFCGMFLMSLMGSVIIILFHVLRVCIFGALSIEIVAVDGVAVCSMGGYVQPWAWYIIVTLVVVYLFRFIGIMGCGFLRAWTRSSDACWRSTVLELMSCSNGCSKNSYLSHDPGIEPRTSALH